VRHWRERARAREREREREGEERERERVCACLFGSCLLVCAHACACACVCVCARVCARIRACASACKLVDDGMSGVPKWVYSGRLFFVSRTNKRHHYHKRVTETRIDWARRDKWYRSALHFFTIAGRQLRISLAPKRIRQVSCVRFWCADFVVCEVCLTPDSILLQTAAVIPFSCEAWVIVSSVMARLELARRLSPTLPSSGS